MPIPHYPITPLATAVAAVLFVFTAAAKADDQVTLDNVYITGGKSAVLQQPGSATLIDDVALEKFEYTDINRVLNAVPGVNLQEEDGYGLRPNIGLRGTSPERSKKITIMEDGVLIGPAPYSAPAAYYFPNISRMSAVEVFKGPSSIQYGPATVGGAINLVSRAIPFVAQGELDVQYGSDNFQRYNAYYGEQAGDFGYLLEGLRVSSDGFKKLDGGGDTGFTRNDVNLKTSYQILGDVSHSFLLKLGYADEKSDETYLGLTLDDFKADPYRRYASSQLDNMDWTHTTVHFTHQAEFGANIITTDLYRHDFDRDWFKLNRFNTADAADSLQNILADPTAPRYLPFYRVLTGQSNSVSSAQQLRLGNNGRQFISQGIQVRFNTDWQLAGIDNELEVGLRYHQDEIKRHHTEQSYRMISGQLQAVAGTFGTTTRNKGEADAVAVYIKDDIKLDDTTITLGVRHENIKTKRTTYGLVSGATVQVDELDQSVTVPGVGVYSQLTEQFGVLAGVHKGFTAATPGGSGNIEPEESVNYEIGGRYSGAAGQAEVIAFVNDYTQFSGTCSFSQGCSNTDLDNQVNAGSATVYGLEASWGNTFATDTLMIPVALTYTFSLGEFGEDFTDATGAFGEKNLRIEKGDRIGYLPEHRVNAQVGVEKGLWAVNLSALYQSEMRNVPGQGAIPVNQRVDAYALFDASASYQLTPELQLYSTLDNLLDKEYAVANRPYGFRPGKPRSLNVGAKLKF